MKKFTVVLAAVLLLAPVLPLQAQESVLPASANKALIEDNLFVGMKSDNLGLQKGCIYMLGEIKSDRAVIPLMSVLHNASDASLRVAAAWSLCKIGDARGVYAVKMATQFDENQKVQNQCAWFYENYVQHGSFMFIEPEYNLAVVRNN